LPNGSGVTFKISPELPTVPTYDLESVHAYI